MQTTITGTSVSLLTKPNVVFFHIPKTAGTTVTNYFRSVYGDEQCFLSTADQALKFEQSNTPGRYLSAHMNYDEYQKIQTLHKSVIFFREPKARILSTYYFLRHFKLSKNAEPPEGMKTAKEMDLKDWLRNAIDNISSSNLKELDNLYARILMGREYSNVTPLVKWEEHADEFYITRYRLRQFDAIGIVENFDPSMEMIAKAIGLRAPTAQQIKPKNTFADNTADKNAQREEVTAEIDYLLSRLTHTDQQIYDYAAKLSKEQCIVYSSDLMKP